MEWGIGAASVIMRSLCQSVLVKRELIRFYVSTLTYDLLVMIERTVSRIQATEMSLFT